MGMAADRYAKITREQYEDWKARFYPIQRQWLEASQSGALLKAQLRRADDHSQATLRSARQGQQNRMGRYGLSVETAGHADDARMALSAVGAKNALRDHERQRAMHMLSGAGMGIRGH